jgi:hypothetical protein
MSVISLGATTTRVGARGAPTAELSKAPAYRASEVGRRPNRLPWST